MSNTGRPSIVTVILITSRACPLLGVDCHGGSNTLLKYGRGIAPSSGMLHWSLVFLIIAIIAGILGFTGIAGAAMGIAKILFFVFLAVWLIALLVVRRAV
jgi:uncharacterized membrane protein YtjA (UPF0391 family)